jgi:CRISPR system Cascade subunit CasD
MDGLILRLDAPLMSFGGVRVDRHNVTDRFPGLSMLTGLLANALGWTHGEADRLNRLQARLVTAARWDAAPSTIVDFHSVNLGSEKMKHPAWTSRGIPEPGKKRSGTHLRYRHYLVNGLATVVLALIDDDPPDLDDLERALQRPARPLFLGRKTCLPSVPILAGRVSGADVLDMLRKTPRAGCPVRQCSTPASARWPAGLSDEPPDRVRRVYDLRDWRNQWHAGSRLVAEGLIEEVGP